MGWHPGRSAHLYRIFLKATVKEKDLGVTMNANMKVSEQCRIAASKANQVLGMNMYYVLYYETTQEANEVFMGGV